MLASISNASKLIGVSISTLRRWEKSGHIAPVARTVGGHRRYSIAHLRESFGLLRAPESKLVIGYARVSSSDQRDDLERQKKD